jgi:N-acetylglucosamine repressor
VDVQIRTNRDLNKEMNRKLILNIIRRYAPLSRTRLIELSNLSAGAISQITGDLLEKRWILEAGEHQSTGGRRQVLLRLNPDAGAALGIKLMEDRVVCAITDLETRVLNCSTYPLHTRGSPTAVSEALIAIIKECIAASRFPAEHFLGVGIGLAGIVDPQTSIVHYSPYFDWKDIPLAPMIQSRIHLPVFIENDVNTLTLSEQLFGLGRHIENFAVVTIGRGIGFGLVVNNGLYQGAHGGVGEIGHMVMDVSGPACDCGKRGCLEALAADPAVIKAAEKHLAHGVPSFLVSPLTMNVLKRAADAGDTLARKVLAQSGTYIGIALANMLNLLSPSLLIISGEGVAAGEHRIEPMMKAIREHTLNGLLDNVQITIQITNDQEWAQGAASLVIGKVFESPLVDYHQKI